MSGRRALIAVLALGALLRLAWVARPLDHRLISPWRQADYAQIARNFDREGMNPLFPRVDWRGDTPGFVEAELPVVPWLGALLYRLFGEHVQLARAVSAAFSTGALLAFALLARRLLPPDGALLAVAAFALNPLLVHLGASLQPDGLMLMLAILAVLALERWERSGRAGDLLAAAAGVGGAVLTKASAAVLGLVLAAAVLRRRGVSALAAPAVWAAALLAVGPPLAWYAWTHRFWERWGLSLGISNESHLIGLDVLWPPEFLLGNLKWELLGVWTPPGALLALAALRAERSWVRLGLVWYGAACSFYLLAARTSGDDWAFYYHAASVAPACLLAGAGGAALLQERLVPPGGPFHRWQRPAAALLAAGTVIAAAGATWMLVHHRDHARDDLLAMRTCALELGELVPADGLIVTNGGDGHDRRGHSVAHNESMLFAWMDRRGFNYANEDAGVETLERIAARGGRWWIARETELDRNGLRAEAAARYPLLAECRQGYALYDLRPPR